MPVFDWTRTELARKRPDGSTVMAYTQEAIDKLNPEEMFNRISENSNGTVMPGWEPERMARIKEIFELYKDIDDEILKWQFIRMIRHGAYLDFRESSLTKKIS